MGVGYIPYARSYNQRFVFKGEPEGKGQHTMINLEQARDVLRIDGTDNDAIIISLLYAIPGYIEVTTGMPEEQQDREPMVDTVAGFLLKLWYNAEQAEAEKLQRTINSLLKCITLKVQR